MPLNKGCTASSNNIHSPNTTQIATFLPAQLNELHSLSLSSPPHSYTIIYIVLCARAIKKSNVIIVVGFFIFLPFSDLPSSSFFLKMYSVHDMITSVSKSLADRASVGARTTTSRRETESGITFAFHVIYLPHPSQVRKSSYMYLRRDVDIYYLEYIYILKEKSSYERKLTCTFWRHFTMYRCTGVLMVFVAL